MPKVDKEKEKEEKERKAREKQMEKEAKERQKVEAKEAKEREKAAALAQKQQEKEAKEREKLEKRGSTSSTSSSSAATSATAAAAAAAAAAVAASSGSSPSASPTSLTPPKGAAGSAPFARKSVHSKKEPERKGSAQFMVPPTIKGDVAPPVALEAYQKAHIGAPLVRKDHQGSSRFRQNQAPPLEKLPLLTSVKNSAEKQELLIKKLRQCANVYNFEVATDDVKSKDIKRATLEELATFLKSDQSRTMLTEVVHEEMCKMFTANAFRVLPPPSVINGADFDPEEDEPVLEPSWLHLQLVYDVFCLFLEHSEFQAGVGRLFIDGNFANRLLELFESEDPRERDLLKSVLHRVYGKIIPLRAHIRRAINNIFHKFVFEPPGKHNGIAELLEILGSVINGFTLPLKEEHKVFLMKVLLPLHKAKSLSLFHPQLSYCVIQFLEKDALLANAVMHGLFHIWPRTHSPKEVMFLNELEEMINVIPPDEFDKLHVPFFNRLARCVCSQHFQVAERSLYFFTNEAVLTCITQHVALVLPMLFTSLSRNSRIHWNKNIHTLTFGALKTLMEISPALFEACSQKAKLEAAQAKQSKAGERQARWKQLETLAAKNPLSASVHVTSAAAGLEPSSPSDDSVEDTMAELKKFSLDSDPRSLKNNNTRMRRKSFLPQDQDVQQALQAHKPHGVPLSKSGD